MSRIRMAGSCGMIHRILRRTLKTPSFVLTPSLHGESKHDERHPPPTVVISHKANKKRCEGPKLMVPETQKAAMYI